MSGLIGCMIVLLFSLSFVVPIAMAQVETSPLTIKGDMYFIKDISGSFVYDLHVDKNMQRDRFLVLGRKIEADVIPDVRVVALRPTK